MTKIPIPNPALSVDKTDRIYCPKEHARHTLFCGTHVIQTRNYEGGDLKAVVLRTGESTNQICYRLPFFCYHYSVCVCIATRNNLVAINLIRSICAITQMFKVMLSCLFFRYV